MNDRLTGLSERRSRLVMQVDAQRTALVHQLQPWRGRLALADQGMAAFHYFKSHAAVMIGSALLVALLRPRFTGRWLRRGWMLWQLGRRLRSR